MINIFDDDYCEYRQRQRKFEIGCEGDCSICSLYKNGVCTYEFNEEK